MKKLRIRVDDLSDDAVKEFTMDDVQKVTGGMDSRFGDPIGNYNFKVEIEGVSRLIDGTQTISYTGLE